MSDYNPYEPKTTVYRAEAEDPNKLPEGSAKALLEWVGDDAERAERLLEAEQNEDKPRVTLITSLKKIVDNA